MHHIHEGAKNPLHHSAKMRPSDRPMRQYNTMLFTAFAVRLATKLLALVPREALRFARDGPGHRRANPLQPGLFVHRGMREAEPHRGGGRRVQRQTYARNTATEHVNCYGEIR